MSNEEDRREKRFRRYARLLLRAERYDFLAPRPFTSEALYSVFKEFCDIIAASEHINSQSCTIHLQMYDPLARWEPKRGQEELSAQEKEHIKREEKKHIKRIVKRYRPAGNGRPFSERMLQKKRRHWFRHTLCYPFWKLPKGGAKMVACNRGSPWKDLVDPIAPHKGVADLRAGITKDVFQGNMPRVRDRLSMRATRGFRKLGGADSQIWTGQDWEYVFKSYYSVPIRIHSDGEVVGILKVENKRPDKKQGPGKWEKEYIGDLREPGSLRTAQTVVELEDTIIEWISRDVVSAGDSWLPKASFLSLAHLSIDLEQVQPHGRPWDLIFIPAPDQGSSRSRLDQLRSLRPDKAERPPIQLLIRELSVEETLLDLLQAQAGIQVSFRDQLRQAREADRGAGTGPQTNSGVKGVLRERLGAAKGILKLLTDAVKECLHYDQCQAAIRDCIGKKLFGADFSSDRIGLSEAGSSSPEFSYGYKISVGSGEDDGPQLELIVVIPPSPVELKSPKFKGMLRSQKQSEKVAELFRQVNEQWMSEPDSYQRKLKVQLQGKEVECKSLGEYTFAAIEDGQLRATDLLMDRWAARLQSFVDAVPVAQFDEEDAHKLSWAAFELGKLLEREISYRANTLENPIPLSAMEFYRLPISDFSFVRALDYRRAQASRMQVSLDYHLRHLLEDLSMADRTRYSSRIKDNRSYLLRMGERFDGYLRGNIALWLYLLGKQVFRPDCKKLAALSKFWMAADDHRCQSLEEHGSQDSQNSEEFRPSPPGRELVDWLCMNSRVLTELREGTDVAEASDLLDRCLKVTRQAGNVPEDTEVSEEALGLHFDLWQFLAGLKNLCEKVDLLVESMKDEVEATSLDEETLNLQEALSALTDTQSKFLGDLKFDSPPFSPSGKNALKRTRNAIDRLLKNLRREGLIDKAEFPAPEGGARSNHLVEVFVDAHRSELEDLLFRRYLDFARFGASLLFQLLNSYRETPRERRAALSFHKACHRLRARLCTSPQDIENDPQAYREVKAIYGSVEGADAASGMARHPWNRLVDFIDACETTRFAELMVIKDHWIGDDPEKPDYLQLNLASLYKRARALHNVLRHQRSPAALEWDLGRSDLLGARINCLFKSQVFAVYEYIWNRGDPFFEYDFSKSSCASRFSKDGGEMLGSHSRNRWLCIRSQTKSQQGYYAIHANALVDPVSPRKDYWQTEALNLANFRIIINGLFCEFFPDKADQYKAFARHRSRIQQSYTQWCERTLKTPHDPSMKMEEGEFGPFLFEGVIRLLIVRLRAAYLSGDPQPSKALNRLLTSLAQALKEACKASRKVDEAFLADKDGPGRASLAGSCFDPEKGEGSGVAGHCGFCGLDSQPGSCALYAEARSLLERGAAQPAGQQVGRLKERLQIEEEFFRETAARNIAMPLIYIYRDRKYLKELGTKLRDWEGYASKPELRQDLVRRLWKLLRRIRRRQGSYLVATYGMDADGNLLPNLSLRGEESVLNRIQNLVMLFDPDLLDASRTNEQLGSLTCFDLYQYLRWLIPVEIQVRTELTNTLAEQYHDPVYKGMPPQGTGQIRGSLERMGERLNWIDWELDRNFEEFISTSQMERQIESNKKMKKRGAGQGEDPDQGQDTGNSDPKGE